MPGRKFAQMDTGAWAGEFLNSYYCPLYPLPFSSSMFQNEDKLSKPEKCECFEISQICT